MDMKRNEIIIEVMNLYDELNSLRTQNTLLREKVDELSNCDPNGKTSQIDKIMLNHGKAKLFNKCTYSWNQVRIEFDEELQTHKCVTNYHAWLREKISKDYVAEYMSYAEFVDYFAIELQDMYAKEVDEALLKAKKGEE